MIPVGVIHSPYSSPEEAPRQGVLSGEESEIEIFEEYAEALEGVEELHHLVVLYWFDRGRRDLLKATPPGEVRERGVFATRSPHRPNPIALCVVEVLERKGRRLRVRGLDALDGSPLLDLKPLLSEGEAVKL